jgi:protein transport protein SEC24
MWLEKDFQIVNNGLLDTATGQSQWEHPAELQESGGPPRENTASPTQAAGHPSKKRHYAVNQAQAYSGPGEQASYGDGGYGGQMAQPAQQPSQLFTPGLTGDNQFTAQQGRPQQPYYQGQGQEPEYINAPAFGQQQQPPYVGQQQMGQLADQFGQMGMGGQRQVGLCSLLDKPLFITSAVACSADCQPVGDPSRSSGTHPSSPRSSPSSECESLQTAIFAIIRV